MASRYENRRSFRNASQLYFNILEERGISNVIQFTTPIFNKVTQRDRLRISQIQKIWTVGDRLYKLAGEHYGDPKLWWVIARYNYKPTDAHFKLGDIVYIPMPIETMLEYYRS